MSRGGRPSAKGPRCPRCKGPRGRGVWCRRCAAQGRTRQANLTVDARARGGPRTTVGGIGVDPAAVEWPTYPDVTIAEVAERTLAHLDTLAAPGTQEPR